MASPGYTGELYVAPGPSTAFTGEATTGNTGNVVVDGVTYAAYKVYTINAAAKRYWDPENSVTVYKGGVEVTTGFTVQYCGGIIIFAAANLNTDVITVTGKYYTYSKAAGVKGKSLKMGHKLGVSTHHNDSDEEYTALTKNGSGTLELIDVDAYFCDLLGERVVGVFHLDGTYNTNDSTGARYECYLTFTDWQIDMPYGELITASHNFVVTKERHFRSS